MPNGVEEFLTYADYTEPVIQEELANTDINRLIETVLAGSDCILYGPPGTSKTYMINQLKDQLGTSIDEFEIVQFHANYSYDEFIEGIVPDVVNGGFKYQSGSFFDFCDVAKSKEKLCIFVIDEINRANITAVFGEVMNLIEDKGQRVLKTSKRKLSFTIPKNVVIVGTMNTADKSLAKLDFALRRRFRFLPVYPSQSILSTLMASRGIAENVGITLDEYIKCFSVINAKIIRHPLLGKELTLGHILWLPKASGDQPYSADEICTVFREMIFPQLENYCGANKDTLGSLLGVKIRDKVVNGFEISNEDALEFLNSIKNSQMVGD